MKGLRLVLTLALVIASLLVMTVGVSAQSGTWVSGIMVQNQSLTDPADITITFYWAEGQALAGQVAYVHNDTIAAGGSKNYYVPAHLPGLPQGFVGSAVVSANQPIAANLNTQVPTSSGSTPSDPNRMGTASGILMGTTNLYFTQVMKTYYGWNSYVAVQNTSPDTQASATIRYYKGDGTEVTNQTVNISPNGTYIFRQSENAGLDVGFTGSAVVTGSQPLAGIANFYAAGDSNTTAQFQSYNASGQGAMKLYAPRIVRHYYGYEGALRIQNVGTASTDVTITYTFGGTNYTDNYTIAPAAAKDLYMGNAFPALGTASGAGSAVITSASQPIIATVNEDNRTLGVGSTYNAIADGTQTNGLLFPQMTSRYYGYSGAVRVQNVGTSEAAVVVTYSMPGRADTVVNDTIAAGTSKLWFTPNVVAAPNFNGTVTVTSNQPIVGVADYSYRQDINAGDGWAAMYGDTSITYNGINK